MVSPKLPTGVVGYPTINRLAANQAKTGGKFRRAVILQFLFANPVGRIVGRVTWGGFSLNALAQCGKTG